MLDERCPECGFVAADVDPRASGSMVRPLAARWQDVLARVEARERPSAATWSPTEYGCHVRDVFTVFNRRLRLMLAEDDPVFDNWDQDQTAIDDDYASQLPGEVSSQLVAAAEAIARTFDGVPDDAWGRVGRRSNGSVFTVETLALYFLHDVAHHLHDVRG
ncbi:MAG: hypothetical protein JWP31_1258 [Aeromicrobium sp.]|nr:hypothetical protein [Aeromicrobium sp.]